jgi:hypothetical protein
MASTPQADQLDSVCESAHIRVARRASRAPPGHRARRVSWRRGVHLSARRASRVPPGHHTVCGAWDAHEWRINHTTRVPSCAATMTAWPALRAHHRVRRELSLSENSANLRTSRTPLRDFHSGARRAPPNSRALRVPSQQRPDAHLAGRITRPIMRASPNGRTARATDALSAPPKRPDPRPLQSFIISLRNCQSSQVTSP